MPRRTHWLSTLFAPRRGGAAAEDQAVDSGLTQATVALNQKRQHWIAWLVERKLLPLQSQVAAGASPAPFPASRGEE